ncbi:MAG: hypothetical protein WAM97_02230 [Acidimicrobiales bacterium]
MAPGAWSAPPGGAVPPGPPAYAAPQSGAPKGFNKKQLQILGGVVAVIVVIIVVVVVATGGSSSNGPSAAASAFIHDVLTDSPAACSFFPVSEQTQCNGVAASVFSGSHGSVNVVSQVVQGNEALVAVTGTFCAPFVSQSGNDCASNSNPSAGMPTSSGDFAAAFSAAQNESSSTLSPFPMVLTNGKWLLAESS